MSRREKCTVVMMCMGAISVIIGMFGHDIPTSICGAAVIVFAGCYEISTAIRERN